MASLVYIILSLLFHGNVSILHKLIKKVLFHHSDVHRVKLN